jgi:hypothetical protein
VFTAVAERYRDIDFQGPGAGRRSGRSPARRRSRFAWTTQSLTTCALVEKAGGGNYQTLINEALLAYIPRRSTLDVVRKVVREELAPYSARRKSNVTVRRTRARAGPSGR